MLVDWFTRRPTRALVEWLFALRIQTFKGPCVFFLSQGLKTSARVPAMAGAGHASI